MTGNICVVGSINIDMVIRTPRFPATGETILGGPFMRHPGGKGANQAVAAHRCGASVRMLGCVGDDDDGRRMIEVLKSEGVDTSSVCALEDATTGVAQIIVEETGDNRIVVAPGANTRVGIKHLSVDAISSSQVLLAQLEIPIPTVLQAATIAAAANTRVVLNAAPAAPLPPELLDLVDVLVVNIVEAGTLSGRPESAPPRAMAGELGELGVGTVVITLGADGSFVWQDGYASYISAASVDAVDTVGAGDAFVGALAAALARGLELGKAVRLASAAGGLAVTREGAIPSLPRLDDVEKLAATLP